MVVSDKRRMPIGLRRASAVVAITALALGGAKVVGDHTEPGSGFSTVATVGAEPTGPTGPGGGGGMTGPPGGGSQFQPPSMPSQPDYQGGNQPPLNQNGGVNIYNTPAQGAPQQPGQANSPQQGLQPGQNADGTWERAANGEQQPIDHGPAEYTQGPGKPNPDYQAPGQGSAQQGQQSPQQGQQPSEAPTQTQQPQTPKPSATKEPEPSDRDQDSDRMLDCVKDAAVSAMPSSVDGRSAFVVRPASFKDEPATGNSTCRKCDPEKPKKYNDDKCDQNFIPMHSVDTDSQVFTMPCGYIYDPESKVTDPASSARHDYCTFPAVDEFDGVDFTYSCARHDICMDFDDSSSGYPDPHYHGCNAALHGDLVKACDLTYPGVLNSPDRWACEGTAEVYYWAVEGAH